MRIGTSPSVPANLSRAMSQLAVHSLRVSTFRQINHGWDDPAGLIAAESLRSDLADIEAASATARNAIGVVHTADSALASVSNLTRSIRGNVLEVAGGMLSSDQVAAKQLEIDAALEAIHRIGQTTSFAGRKLFVGGVQSNPQSDQVTLSLNFMIDGESTAAFPLPKIDPSLLGGSAGHLSDLASGSSASLSSGNWAEAIRILDAAQSQVLEGRAEVGAMERYTIGSSQALMDSMQENLATALSEVSDADVALESAQLLQSEILAKTSIAALSIAGHRHQLVRWLMPDSR